MAAKPPAPRPDLDPGEGRPEERSLERVDILHLPIGVYVLDGEGRFRDCNDGVRQILGLPAQGAVDAQITDFYAEPSRFAELCDAALRAERRGLGFEKAIVHLRVGDRDVYVEDYLKPLRDSERDLLIGYAGCMADITEEHRSARQSAELKRQVEELTFDIGRILHANTSTLLMVNQTLLAASSALNLPRAGRPLLEADANADPEVELGPLSAELVVALERLLEAEPEQRAVALPEEDWNRLQAQVEALRDLDERVPVKEMRAPTLRLSAAVIAHTCRRIEPGHLSRERVRSVLRVADELLRVACFFEVVKTRAAVVQMDLTLRALRDFITSEVRVPEKRRVLGADHLIQEAVKQLGDFAQASNVEIDWQRRGSDLTVMGNERDLLRAVCNILHNALKYSWRRDKGASPWVAIRVVEVEEESFVDLEFENWGVPITQSEINEGLLFQMGYRGKWSTDRGRLGTGIGLTDSQRVAHAHGGDLRVESRPVHSTSLVPGDREYYERPFLTKVVLRLPLAG